MTVEGVKEIRNPSRSKIANLVLLNIQLNNINTIQQV